MADESAGDMGKPLSIYPSRSKNKIIEITIVKTVTRESTATDCDSHLIMLRFPSVLGKKYALQFPCYAYYYRYHHHHSTMVQKRYFTSISTTVKLYAEEYILAEDE
jgi:hypothetical protein